MTQLNLMTGKTNTFTLTGQTSPVAYTLPHGLNILAFRVLTAAGPRLLIDAGNSCTGSGLLWYNPGTHAEQWLFSFSAHLSLNVVPFTSIENGAAL